MWKLLIFIALLGFVLIWAYFSKFSKKKIFHNVDIAQILTLFVPPVIFAIFFLYLGLSVSSNPRMNITEIQDGIFIILLGIFLVIGAVGNGAHFTAKCLSNYLKKSNAKKAKKANYFFHIDFGHNIVYIFTFLLIALGILFEFHHPSITRLSGLEILIILISGILLGFVWTHSITYSSVDKKYYIAFGGLLIFIFLIIYSEYSLNLSYLPYSVFLYSCLATIAILLSIILFFEKRKIFLIKYFISKEHFKEWVNLNFKILTEKF